MGSIRCAWDREARAVISMASEAGERERIVLGKSLGGLTGGGFQHTESAG